MDYVFGYTFINDVSARDWQLQTSQWIMGKTFDTFCPMGPWIVTKDEIADPHNLRIGLRLNDETVQDSSTKELIFGIPEIVEHLSKVFTFEPGDVISTGTPPGVGLGMKPPRWLKPGETMTVFIEGIGELVNPTVAEV
jgi:2-keto-4-pentenoate hydratase/2-oxohepta-3-ene-1,7-dioic acid hydratase in catechol pathway